MFVRPSHYKLRITSRWRRVTNYPNICYRHSEPK